MMVMPDAVTMMPMMMEIVVVGEGRSCSGQARHSDGENHGDFFHRFVLDN
jgi:hypothetical protein